LGILHPQHRRVREHGLHMGPDTRLNHCGTKTAAGTRPRDIPRIAQGADIPAALRTPRADHPPTTAPTDQETPQQIRMLSIVALRALTVPGELSLRPFPGLG